MIQDILSIAGFDWNEGNFDKNLKKHKVTTQECEQVFLNDPLIFPDTEHSYAEERFAAYGKTNSGRKLTVVFTWRAGNVRIISARDQSRRERQSYKF